jgi:hypothetical protein
MTVYEKRPQLLELTSKAGRVYFESNYDYSWWRRHRMDGRNNFIGCRANLPKEIKLQLIKMKMYARELKESLQYEDDYRRTSRAHK